MEYLYNGQWFEVQIKAVDTIPVGAIIDYPSLTAPYGYLLCDGRAVSRTEYADLFAVYGTQFGAGDGSTTFNLPDYSGRTGVGINQNDSDFNAIGKTLGEKTHLLSVNEMPSHFHGGIKVAQNYLGAWNTDGSGNTFDLSDLFTQSKNDQNKFVTEETGGSQAHNNIQPSIVSAYYVKYEQSVGVVANVHNESNSSEQDVYSCKYINDINTYSTDEVFTGKFWIDGKPIYRKVVEKNITLAVGDNTFAHNISNISEVTSVSYTFEPSWDSTMRGTEAYLAKNGIGARIYTTSITIESDSLTWTGIFRFVIEYTKTTD